MPEISRDNALLAKKPLALYLQYLFPSLCASLVIAGNYLIDTICVGMKIGEVGLAALNVAVPVTGLLYAIGFMFAYGASNLYSNLMGEGRSKEARSYYTTSAAVLAAIVLTVTVLGVIFTGPISILLCNGAPFHAQTAEYLLYVFWFAPFYCFEAYCSVFIRNDNAPVFSMLGTVLDCSLNIVLDYVLIWKFGMGMKGASLATGIALIVGAGVDFSATFRRSSKLKFRGSRKQDLAEKYGITYLDDEEFFSQSDIIVLTCPHAENTHHLIHKQTLAMMKPCAVLINPSRGGLIDTEALIEALRSRQIAGAALDAYEEEPLLESPLFELDNVLLTPHIGGLADKQIHDVAVASSVNCVAVLNGAMDEEKLICR